MKLGAQVRGKGKGWRCVLWRCLSGRWDASSSVISVKDGEGGV